MISNLPILAGDKVKVVLLQKGYDGDTVLNKSGYVYSNGLLSPLTLPISAEYNDYGGVENIEDDWNSALVLGTLKRMFKSKLLLDDNEVEAGDWDLEKLIDGIERGSFNEPAMYWGKTRPSELDGMLDKLPKEYLEKPEWQKLVAEKAMRDSNPEGWTPLNLSFVMIREDVWNETVKIGLGTGEYYMESGFAKGGKWINTLFDSFDLKTKKSEDASIESFYNPFTMGEGPRLKDDYVLQTLYIRALKENPGLAKDIKRQVIEFRMVSSMLSNLRKGWMVQPGAGSQHSGWESHLAFNNAIAAIAKAKYKEYNEDEYNEDDE
jgi:hypothetical protein